tara:strand:+ start:162 stop:278 length:117 start_codon:yes stop_codon:yes gene_type:complete
MRYKVKEENIKKLKLFLNKINRTKENGKRDKLGRVLPK